MVEMVGTESISGLRGVGGVARSDRMVTGASPASTGDGGGRRARGQARNGSEATEETHGEKEGLTVVALVASEA